MAIDKTLIKYFSVKWTALVSIIDGLDLDDIPDTDSINGTVTFTPKLGGQPIRYTSEITTEPFSIFPLKRKININSGEFSDQARKYIKLECATPNTLPSNWNWEVAFDLSYNGAPIVLSTAQFMGVPGEVIDLTNELPVKDLVSGIESARGPRGFSIWDITLAGANDQYLVFTSTAPGHPVVQNVLLPKMVTASNAAAVAVTASELSVSAKNTSVTAKDNAVVARTATEAARDLSLGYRDAANAYQASALASKNSAGTSETNALASKNAAATSATNAGTSETNALASKNAAATSATNAATDRGLAQTAATNAGTDRTAAQTARTGAETARTGAEQARDAATTMVVPDSSVSRPKLKTEDVTNLIMGGGFENGIEATDWTIVTGTAAVDTTQFFYGTRSMKISGAATELRGPAIPTGPGEVWQFSGMILVAQVVTGSGGLRVQALVSGTWNDVAAQQQALAEAPAVVTVNTWQRCYMQVTMPVGTVAVRWRLATSWTGNTNGVFYDDMDFRRIPEILPLLSVGTGQLAAQAVTVAKVAPNAIDTSKIIDANVTLAKLAADSVDSSKIVNGSVALADLASNSVDSSKIVDGSIATADIGLLQITTALLADGSSTLAKQAANSVDSSKIVDGSIQTADIGLLQITTALLADGSSTLAKQAANSVDSSKIVDLSITGGDIANATITGGKFANYVLPYDYTHVIHGGTRKVDLGDLPEGIRIPSQLGVTAIVIRNGTADASGNTTVNLMKNGVAVSGATVTFAATAVGVVATMAGMPVVYAPGDYLSFQVTAIGVTPGKRLYADIIGAYLQGK